MRNGNRNLLFIDLWVSAFYWLGSLRIRMLGVNGAIVFRGLQNIIFSGNQGKDAILHDLRSL